MKQPKATLLEEPRYEKLSRNLSIVGVSRSYPAGKVGEIAEQWASFAPLIPLVSDVENPTTYGIIYNGSGGSFDYLSGIEWSKGTGSPGTLVRLDLVPQNYVVFKHNGHIAALRDTCDAIWSDWLPASKKLAVEAPWFERYGESFNPETGEGGLEVWIAVSP